MNSNLIYKKDDLLFIPLGGAGEIGLNCYLYHYQGKWLITDLGLGFADEYYPGIEILVPNIKFLIQNRHHLAGILITHAHEDHLGAVQYLWPELKCPIYTTKFTSAVLKAKLAEVALTEEVPIIEVPENGKVNVGPFDIELFHLTHSIPEMHGFMLRTDKGNIFHTGDWKLDYDPVIGNVTNETILRKFGDEGVLAMVCDSTNIFSHGHSGSEGDLKQSLSDLISGFKNNLVIVTTFASNIARVHSVAKAAEAAGRRVALSGRSLWRMHDAAKESGYLQDLPPFVTEREIKKIRREDLLILCTGCQGEPMAAARKIAYGSHPTIRASKGDAIIFASKIIPGNEKKIFHLFNKFCKLGVEVLTEKDHFVHVSGHPCRDEVAKMYEMLKPKIAIPVHGEPMHLHEHSKFAIKHGARQSIEIENGTAIKITETEAIKIGFVPTGCLAIDGNFILPSDSEILKIRRRMRDDGFIVVTIIMNNKSKLVRQPLILTPGVLDPKDDEALVDAIIEEISDHLNKSKYRHEKDIAKYITSTVRRIIKIESGKDPEIIVQQEWI